LPKIHETRSAYTALREHFLKYIEHPDDLQSTTDPLADDEEVCSFLMNQSAKQTAGSMLEITKMRAKVALADTATR